MDEDFAGDGGPPRLSKRFSDAAAGTSTGKGVVGEGTSGGEVDYKTKAGTAWSHNFLNQKPWHPLSYPNQRRKWIAEQTHAQRQRRAEEVAREFAQEQEFFRQTALVSKKEKEKMEMMKAVSFMYVRPPGYNAESAKAAEVADEKKKLEEDGSAAQDASTAPQSMPEATHERDRPNEDKSKKTRPKDVFGRPLPTEEEFEVLKNAPRLETGVPVRIKPFAVEIRNVRCVRCGTYGHQSGDRECLLKDAIMPNDESRLKRDDPLTAIMAQTDSSEPLKWELKQRPGMSPPRGGFRPDDPNQQIVAEDIFDEYGGFLSGGDIPALLTNFTGKKSKKHSNKKRKHKRQQSASGSRTKLYDGESLPSSDTDMEEKKSSKTRHSKKRRHHWTVDLCDDSGSDQQLNERASLPSSECDSGNEGKLRRKRKKKEQRYPSESDSRDKRKSKNIHKKMEKYCSSESDRSNGRRRSKSKVKRKERHGYRSSSSSDDSDYDHHYKNKHKKKERHCSDSDTRHESRKSNSKVKRNRET